MDLETKIRLMFISEKWITSEFNLAWVFTEVLPLDSDSKRSIQVSKDLVDIDLLSPTSKKLFEKKQGRYIGALSSKPVRFDEMFRLLKNYVCGNSIGECVSKLVEKDHLQKKVTFGSTTVKIVGDF